MAADKSTSWGGGHHHRAQLQAVAILRLIVLPQVGQTVFQLAELDVPVHGGHPPFAIQLRAEFFGAAAQLLRQIIGLVEGELLMDQGHTRTGGVGLPVLLVGFSGQSLQKDPGAFQANLSSSDKAHVVPSQNHRRMGSMGGCSSAFCSVTVSTVSRKACSKSAWIPALKRCRLARHSSQLAVLV